ncbi:hypothetical protein [Microbacterium sp. UBA837]|uniref:hypothetical protein n=1 Tax=Microbacterium sp. UBA837 TaxID=1946956 RepID=UPI0025D8FA4C|nr:hypothetical protein [Microbacterium sp. UBA837]|tara:strand:+ start:303 stop:668 length:366 start_codon:yes stop_codon:yes gene_type:complete
MSTEDEYTPTTEEVRADHARSLTYPKFVSPIRARQFDRWLACLLEGERARARTETDSTLAWIERVLQGAHRAKDSDYAEGVLDTLIAVRKMLVWGGADDVPVTALLERAEISTTDHTNRSE